MTMGHRLLHFSRSYKIEGGSRVPGKIISTRRTNVHWALAVDLKFYISNGTGFAENAASNPST